MDGYNRDTSSGDIEDRVKWQKLNRLHSKGNSINASETECVLCKVVVGFIQSLVQQNMSKDEIAEELGKLCVDFDIEDKRVCTGIVEEFKVIIMVFDKCVR